MDFKQWKMPGSEFRSAPFWSWNGEMTLDRVVRQVESMKKAGMGGFYMHSRSGLKTEYLGEQWFDCIKACVEKAREIDMKACLYDEDTYSSGFAGGLNTRDFPENRQKVIVVRELCPLKEREIRLGIFAILFDNDKYMISYRKADAKTKLLDGERLLAFDVIVYCNHFAWHNYSYALDMCNSEAVDKFIETTYEPYFRRYGKDFGGIIPSIFSDEVNIAWLEHDKYDKNIVSVHLWTKDYDQFFNKHYGYDIKNVLPEIMFEYKGKAFSKVAYEYIYLICEMFIQNYSKKIGDWCFEHNIAFTGHLHLKSFSNIVMFGSAMRNFYYWQWPGMDILTDNVAKVSSFKQVSSVVNQFNKERMLCETYCCTGWDWPLERHKFHAGWQFALGVNNRCQHLTHYSLAGWGKKDYPASISWHSPWWKYYNLVEDYYGRLSYILTRGKYASNVLVIAPQDCILGFYKGYHLQGYGKSDTIMSTYESFWEKLSVTLVQNHIDYDFGDELLMAEYAKANKGSLQFGSMQYTTVIIPPMYKIQKSTLKLLEQSGVKVIYFEPAPKLLDGEYSKEAINKLSIMGECLDSTDEASIQELLALISSNVTIKENGVNADYVWSMTRNVDGGQFLFIQSHEKDTKTVTIILEKDFGEIVKWDLATTDRYIYPSSIKDGKRVFKITLTETANALFSYGIEVDELIQIPSVKKATINVKELGNTFSYKLSEPNAFPLDYCRYKISDVELSDLMPVTQAEDFIIKHYNLEPKIFYNSAQPWYLYKKGIVDISPRDAIQLCFEFESDIIPTSCKFAVEYNSLYTIKINENSINKIEGFFIDEDIKTIDITPFVKKGTNTITVDCKFKANMELENMYLLGDFGVTRINPTKAIEPGNIKLCAKPNKLSFGSWVGQGLDFFTGSVYYLAKITKEANEPVVLDLGDVKCTAAAVYANGKTIPLAWGPFEFDLTDILNEGENEVEIELVGGRKNIMGPLHVFRPTVVEPDDFIHTSPNWTREYQLNDHGIF